MKIVSTRCRISMKNAPYSILAVTVPQTPLEELTALPQGQLLRGMEGEGMRGNGRGGDERDRRVRGFPRF